MAKFRVELSFARPQIAVIIVDAADADEAQEIAIQRARDGQVRFVDDAPMSEIMPGAGYGATAEQV